MQFTFYKVLKSPLPQALWGQAIVKGAYRDHCHHRIRSPARNGSGIPIG